MSERLVEEKNRPKFKVGDKVKDKNNRVWFIVRVSETFFDISRICAPNAQGYFVPMEDQDDYELVPDKFDINNLIPFESRVLVRDYDYGKWFPSFWGCYDRDSNCERPFITVGWLPYKQCIPYEGNEHLLCKTDDCIDFYKTWER